MTEKRIGIVAAGSDSGAILAGIERAEQMGIPAAWLTTGGAGLDALTIFAGAAVSTGNVLLGTAITPTFPRHPIVVAQQAQVIAQLAPGRFRLGIGPSGRAGVVDMFGINFNAPLGHLREYLHVLRSLLQEGSVDFDGTHYKAHARISSPVDLPVMASALGEKAFELCGAESDGAISWVCPGKYLRDVALPALKAGADRAGRPVPPLIAHTPVCVHDDPEEAREAVRRQFGGFARTPFYQAMFTAAGYPETANGSWSDAMIDAVALYGNEAQVTEKLEELLSFGMTEVMASPTAAGDDLEASLDRTLGLLAQAASQVS